MAEIENTEKKKDSEQKLQAFMHVLEYMNFLNTPLAPQNKEDIEKYKRNVLETLKNDLNIKLRFY